MKKALLLLTGGRGLPDMLVIKYLHPDITYNITTKQGLATAESLKEMAQSEYNCQMTIQPPVHPNREENIKNACLNVLNMHQDAEWVFCITSAPKLVSIYAMDIARERGIPCWFLNTEERELISLAKNVSVDTEKLFNATVSEYMKAYQRDFSIPKKQQYRKLAESWYEIARTLALSPVQTHHFISQFRQATIGISNQTPVTLEISTQYTQFIHNLQKQNVLTINQETSSTIQCTIHNPNMREFLKGDWLEIYVWGEINRTGFTDDNQWGYKIATGQAKNELDVAFTYRTLLHIIECKTENDPFSQKRVEYLDTLDSIANSLGQNYTSKFFITNHPDPQKVESFTAFSEQAAKRKIHVLTGKDLPNLGEFLKKQAENPDFGRH